MSMSRILFILALALAALAPAAPARAQVAVIAHKRVAAAAIDAATARNFFTLGKTQWSDGAKVVVVELKPDQASKEAFYKFIGMRPADVRKQWMRVQLSGDGQPPEALASDEAVVKKVAATPGALGYVSAAAVTADVKVLATLP